MSAGYYKVDNGDLLYGPEVQGPGFSLTEENRLEHTYPVHGWTWYDTIEAAYAGENWYPPMDPMDVYWLDSIYANLTPSAKIKVDRIKAEPQEQPA